MKSIGALLIILGLASIGLNLFDTGIELKFLSRIDQWGANIGWAIRGGIVVLGALLWIIGNSMSDSASNA